MTKIKLPFTIITVAKGMEEMTFEEMFSFHLRYFPRFYFFGVIDISLIISVYFSRKLFSN